MRRDRAERDQADEPQIPKRKKRKRKRKSGSSDLGWQFAVYLTYGSIALTWLGIAVEAMGEEEFSIVGSLIQGAIGTSIGMFIANKLADRSVGCKWFVIVTSGIGALGLSVLFGFFGLLILGLFGAILVAASSWLAPAGWWMLLREPGTEGGAYAGLGMVIAGSIAPFIAGFVMLAALETSLEDMGDADGVGAEIGQGVLEIDGVEFPFEEDADPAAVADRIRAQVAAKAPAKSGKKEPDSAPGKPSKRTTEPPAGAPPGQVIPNQQTAPNSNP